MMILFGIAEGIIGNDFLWINIKVYRIDLKTYENSHLEISESQTVG